MKTTRCVLYLYKHGSKDLSCSANIANVSNREFILSCHKRIVFNFIKAYLELIFNIYAMHIISYFCLKVAPIHIVDMYWSISVTYAS